MTTPAEWLSAGPVRHSCTLRWQDMTLPISAGNLRYADAELPSITLSATVPAPDASRDFLRRLDPRQGDAVTVVAGYRFPDGSSVDYEMGTLITRATDEDVLAGALTVEASSVDSLILGEPVREGPAYNRAGVPALVRDLLGRITDAELVTTLPDNLAPEALELLDVNPGEDVAALIETITQTAGLRLYSDGSRFHLIRRPTSAAAGTALDLRTGPGGTVLRMNRRVDVSTWANRVEITAPNPANPEGNLTGIAAAAGGTGPARTWTTRLDRPATLPNLNARARTVLDKVQRLGVGYNLTAVAHYWLRPGMPVRPAGPTDAASETLLARNVDFDLGAGTMSLSTQDDIPATTT